MEKPKQHKWPYTQQSVQQDTPATEIPADVLGSYTGRPIDGEAPIQDADDL